MKKFSQLAWAISYLGHFDDPFANAADSVLCFYKLRQWHYQLLIHARTFIKFFTGPRFLAGVVALFGDCHQDHDHLCAFRLSDWLFIARSSDKMRNFWVLVITLPMWINMLVRTYAWIGILSNGGIAAKLLRFVWIGRYGAALYRGLSIAGMVYNFLPFMILQINTALCKMDKSLLEASHDLGANRFQTFWRVTFPLSLSGVVSGITLVFLPAVSSFFIPKLLGGGSYFLIGNVIENQFITVGEWNFGSAISMIMAVIMMVCMYAIRKIDERNAGRGKEKA